MLKRVTPSLLAQMKEDHPRTLTAAMARRYAFILARDPSLPIFRGDASERPARGSS